MSQCLGCRALQAEVERLRAELARRRKRPRPMAEEHARWRQIIDSKEKTVAELASEVFRAPTAIYKAITRLDN